ncbi:hypothetical protein CYMTET_13485 [Cymbomonas tetramitiformis]|uniref:Uncharacterized protein n=1 Tax=Cymbomonas tetramitiformis TaxID=36881 RepID=A0AAE0GIC5_9CHLO|nr:hypothetical protein CYMTET_13485 [Cymbomonas tetramitiformis]
MARLEAQPHGARLVTDGQVGGSAARTSAGDRCRLEELSDAVRLVTMAEVGELSRTDLGTVTGWKAQRMDLGTGDSGQVGAPAAWVSRRWLEAQPHGARLVTDGQLRSEGNAVEACASSPLLAPGRYHAVREGGPRTGEVLEMGRGGAYDEVAGPEVQAAAREVRKPNLDLLWTQLVDLASSQDAHARSRRAAQLSANLATSSVAAPEPTSTTEREAVPPEQAVSTLVEQVCVLHEAAPAHTLFVVTSGQGDTAEVRRLQEEKYKRLQRIDGWAPWDEPGEARLCQAMLRARKSVCFATVKT